MPLAAFVSSASRLLAVSLCFAFGSASSCLGDDPPEPVECRANCAVEAECGFRTEDECKKTSCDNEGAPKDPAADSCLADAANCLEAAACACDGGCAAIDLCAEGGEENPSCVSDCDVLVEQLTTETYLENRCRIESDCADIATCSSVAG